jgi:hypothetical protein
MESNTIEIEQYEAIPDKPGYLRPIDNASTKHVCDSLNRFLEHKGHADRLDYYGAYAEARMNQPFPKFRWIAVFAVTGTNEGIYIHVEAISQDRIKGDKRELVYLAKTFETMDFAYQVCADIAKFLQA